MNDISLVELLVVLVCGFAIACAYMWHDLYKKVERIDKQLFDKARLKQMTVGELFLQHSSGKEVLMHTLKRNLSDHAYAFIEQRFDTKISRLTDKQKSWLEDIYNEYCDEMYNLTR